MDIDIDLKNRQDLLDQVNHINASMLVGDTIMRHSVGVYFQNIPLNPKTGNSNILYEDAEKLGYIKIDLLNLNIYENIKSNDHLTKLMNTEPNWELLLNEYFCNCLFQISGNFEVVSTLKPKSIEQLAATIAIIRPAKRYLIGKDWNTIFKEVWKKPIDDEYYFKKSHGIAYAMAIVVQMNLIVEDLMKIDIK